MAKTDTRAGSNGAGHVSKAAPVRNVVEIGASGLQQTGGVVREEWLPQLRGPKAVKVYNEMRDNDYTCGGMLFGIEQLLMRSTWGVDANDAPPERAEHLEQCRDDMSEPWSAIVSEAIPAQHGWSYLEIVYKERRGEDGDPPSAYNDGRLGWRKWAARAQETLVRWDIDDRGGIQGMVQRVGMGGTKTIPIDVSLLFRTTHRKNNPEGRSLLRTAYRSWFHKKRTEDVEGIGIDRDLAGVPILWVPAEMLTDAATETQKAALAEFNRMMGALKNDEQAYMILPNDFDSGAGGSGQPLYRFELAGTGSRRLIDTSAVINRWSIGILQSVLADVIAIGHENVGSLALSRTKWDMFNQGMQSLIDEIRNVANAFAVPRLMRLNGWGPPYPVFTCTPIERIDPASFMEMVKAYSDAQVTLSTDDALDEHVRDKVGFPERDEDDDIVDIMPMEPAPAVPPAEDDET